MSNRLNHKIVCCKTIDPIGMLCLKIVEMLVANEEPCAPCDAVDSYRKEFDSNTFLELQEYTQRDPFGDNLNFFRQCITPVSFRHFLFLRSFCIFSRLQRPFRLRSVIRFYPAVMRHCGTATIRRNSSRNTTTFSRNNFAVVSTCGTKIGTSFVSCRSCE